MKITCKTREKSLGMLYGCAQCFCRILDLQERRTAHGWNLSFHNFQIQDFYDFGHVKDPKQSCWLCMCSVRGRQDYWILWASHGLSMASYRPFAGYVQPARLIVLGVSKPVRHPHGPVYACLCILWNPYGTLTGSFVHAVKTPRPPLTARMHLTSPSQEQDFVWTSNGVQVRTAFQASLTTEVLRHIAPCAEDRCMKYIIKYMTLSLIY